MIWGYRCFWFLTQRNISVIVRSKLNFDFLLPVECDACVYVRACMCMCVVVVLYYNLNVYICTQLWNLIAFWQWSSIVCVKHLLGYVIPCVGNCAEEKPCMFNEISSMVILVPIICWKYNLVTFKWWMT